MAGILDFLAQALPRSVFANLQNANLMKGMREAGSQALYGDPVSSVPITPAITAPGQFQQRQQAGAYNAPTSTGGAINAIPEAQRPFLRGMAEGTPQQSRAFQTVYDRAFPTATTAQDEGFTLSPGATRYDKSGKVIAAQPSVTGDDVSVRQVEEGDEYRYGRFDKGGNLLGYVNGPNGKPLGGPRYKPVPPNNDPFQGRGLQAQMLNMLITGDPSTPQYAAAFAQAGKPAITGFDPNGAPIFSQPDISWARKPSFAGPASGQPLSSTPGMPTVSTGEPAKAMETPRAVALANMDQARADADAAKALFFPNGKFDRSIAIQGTLGKGRDARQAIRRSVEVLLRLRTGAAAPETEVNNYTNMFAPSLLDTDEGATLKMKRLSDFFDETQRLSGAKSGQQAQPQGQGALPQGVSEEDVNFTMKKYGVSREEVLRRLGGGQ